MAKRVWNAPGPSGAVTTHSIPPKVPRNIISRPIELPPMRPIHREAKRRARERKALYGD